MTDTTRDLIQRLADALDAETNYTIYSTGERITHPDVVEARAYLAQSEPEYPSDKELLELMPESMKNDFAYAATASSDATGGQVKPGIFRVALNTAALEYAQAVLEHYTS